MNLSILEQLASEEHSIWSHWMNYLFSKCGYTENGDAIIPKSLVDRWKRQASTDYSNLTSQEKQSDRDVILCHHKTLSKL